MLVRHLVFMAMQLVDSSIETTRIYWRRKVGLPEDVVNDPRPLAEIAISRKEPST